MSEWKKYKLGELAYSPKKAIISGPFGSNIGSRFFVKEGIPVIRGNNLPNDMRRFNDEGFVFLTEEKAEELNCYAIKDDLLFTAAGTIGQVGILTGIEKYKKYVISNKQIRVRLNTQIVNPLYAYYWFSSVEMNEFIKNRNTGSTIPLINLSVIKELPINLPNLRVQNTIVEILSSLDDKIELNNKINQELENLAQTLFKRWFIDFEFPNENGEPYKSSGGEMVESELGEIPKGWEVGKFSDLVKISTGKGINKKDYRKDGDYPIIGASGIMGYYTNYNISGFNILTGRVGTLGTVRISNEKVWTSDNVLICEPIYKEGGHYTYFVMKDFDYNSLNRGSTQPLITQTDLKSQSIVLPQKNILSQFQNQMDCFLSIHESNNLESRDLTNLRDMLLPKLISGELELSQIQTIK